MSPCWRRKKSKKLSIRGLKIIRGQNRLKYDLQLTQGEIVAIQGVSGVGKTTLLEAIAGFVNADSGQILWHQQDLTDLPAWQRPVSMLFQDNNLFEHLSVMENLRLAGKNVRPTSIVKAATELGVARQLTRQPNRLSGGQRQRIGLIRTMLRNEPIILLDEPFSELDAETRQQAARWSRQRAKEQDKTVLMVTHQQEDVSIMADRRITLR